jgi:YgiT-type zinc finger domain-containing protein
MGQRGITVEDVECCAIEKDIEANWKGRTVIFRGLEAWVCQTCGEQAYEADDARLMQDLSGVMHIE